MGKVVGFVVGGAMIIAGIALMNPALIIQGAMMIASTALAPKIKGPARTAQEMTLQLGEQPRSAIFGEAAVAGSLVDGFNWGGKYGTDWEGLIIRLADHKCHSLTGFYVNDEYVPYTGDGNYPQFDGSHFEIYFRSDTATQALPSVVTAHGPGWSSTDIGTSGCDVVVAYRADKPDAPKPAWPGGRPRFLFVVKGKLCYDPRLDSTVPGGSGAHRWDTPSTRAWSDNPPVCRYNWVRGIFANDEVDDPAQLLVGRGLSAAEAPPENVFAPANLCDEMVGGEKRYAIAAPVYANQSFIEVEEAFAAACGGTIVTREGSVEIEPGQAKSVVASITDDDLLSGSDVEYNHGILSESDQEWVNTVVARYVEPTQRWGDHAAPVRRDTDDIIADGKPREASLTLRYVRSAKQAGRVAEIARRMGRLWGRAQVVLGPRFCEIEDGDWINWTSARRFDGETRTFRVEAYSIDAKWQNRLTLRQINSSVYSEGEFIEDQAEANPSDIPPDIGAPEVGAWALTTELLTAPTSALPALVISGALEDPAANAIIFEYWRDDGVIDPVADPDDPDWVGVGTFGPGVTRREITSIVSGADYYAAVTYVVDGIPGDRRVLGPVTAGVLDVSGQLATMDDLPPVTINADHTGAVLDGQLPRFVQAVRRQGATDVSAAATWALTLLTGSATFADMTPADGTIELTALAGNASVAVVSTHSGLEMTKTLVINKVNAAPPSTGGGGGGGGGTSAYDTGFNSINSTSMAAISDELTVTPGTLGEVLLSAPLTVYTDDASPNGTFEVLGIWQWWNGASWAGLGTEVASDPDCSRLLSSGVDYGEIDVSALKTGLTTGVPEKFRLAARKASGTRVMYFLGTASGVGR